MHSNGSCCALSHILLAQAGVWNANFHVCWNTNTLVPYERLALYPGHKASECCTVWAANYKHVQLSALLLNSCDRQ